MLQKSPPSPAKTLCAREVLDVPETLWTQRPWSTRREQSPERQPFCDIAASMALAKLSQLSSTSPHIQHFLNHNDIDAWCGVFEWGTAWCASRGDHFWAWASGDGTADARIEIAGSWDQWDDDLAECFAQSLMS